MRPTEMLRLIIPEDDPIRIGGRTARVAWYDGIKQGGEQFDIGRIFCDFH